MLKSFSDLIGAVRALGIETFVDRQEVRRARLSVDPSDFPHLLLDLHDALLAVDTDTATDPTQDAAKMKAALLAVMQFAAARGIDREKLEDVVRIAVEEGRPAPPPSFGLHLRPKSKGKSWKPKLRMPEDRLGFLKRSSAKSQITRERDEVSDRMGSAMPGIR